MRLHIAWDIMKKKKFLVSVGRYINMNNKFSLRFFGVFVPFPTYFFWKKTVYKIFFFRQPVESQTVITLDKSVSFRFKASVVKEHAVGLRDQLVLKRRDWNRAKSAMHLCVPLSTESSNGMYFGSTSDSSELPAIGFSFSRNALKKRKYAKSKKEKLWFQVEEKLLDFCDISNFCQ